MFKEGDVVFVYEQNYNSPWGDRQHRGVYGRVIKVDSDFVTVYFGDFSDDDVTYKYNPSELAPWDWLEGETPDGLKRMGMQLVYSDVSCVTSEIDENKIDENDENDDEDAIWLTEVLLDNHYSWDLCYCGKCEDDKRKVEKSLKHNGIDNTVSDVDTERVFSLNEFLTRLDEVISRKFPVTKDREIVTDVDWDNIYFTITSDDSIGWVLLEWYTSEDAIKFLKKYYCITTSKRTQDNENDENEDNAIWKMAVSLDDYGFCSCSDMYYCGKREDDKRKAEKSLRHDGVEDVLVSIATERVCTLGEFLLKLDKVINRRFPVTKDRGIVTDMDWEDIYFTIISDDSIGRILFEWYTRQDAIKFLKKYYVIIVPEYRSRSSRDNSCDNSDTVWQVPLRLNDDSCWCGHDIFYSGKLEDARDKVYTFLNNNRSTKDMPSMIFPKKLCGVDELLLHIDKNIRLHYNMTDDRGIVAHTPMVIDDNCINRTWQNIYRFLVGYIDDDKLSDIFDNWYDEEDAIRFIKKHYYLVAES